MLSIGQVSARTGLAVSAIRYYEDEGLLTVDRNGGGQRRYHASDIRKLSFVMVSQQLGFSIADIRKQLASLPEGRAPSKADWTQLSRGFRSHLDQRINALTQLREKLDGCIGCGCLSLGSCKLYNPDDAAHAHGSGPRFLLGDKPIAVK